MPRPYRLSPEGRARRRITPETRAKMSASLLGKKRSPETRAKISAAMRARRRITPETRAKMSASRSAWWANPERNPFAGLTQEQRRAYRTLRRKGCARDAALEEARRPVPTRGAA